MNIDTNDPVEVKEKLTNNKPWLGKLKSFSSVKVSPPQQTTLEVKVADQVTTGEKLG